MCCFSFPQSKVCAKFVVLFPYCTMALSPLKHHVLHTSLHPKEADEPLHRSHKTHMCYYSLRKLLKIEKHYYDPENEMEMYLVVHKLTIILASVHW